MKRLFGLIFTAFLLVSCASPLEEGLPKEDDRIVVSARCLETKSMLSSDLSVLWSEEDRITVLSLDGSASVVSRQAGADSPVCEFVVDGWPKDVQPRYAVFNGPSDQVSASIEGRYIRTSIATVQNLSGPSSFGRDVNLSIGEIKHSVDRQWETEMKNVCALVGFSLGRFDNVKSVSVYNRSGGSALSGSFRIFMEDGVPVIKEIVDGAVYASVTMADGESLFRKDTRYYICVRPDIELNPEFIFTLKDGRRYKYRWRETVRIRRSTMMDFGTVDTDAVEAGLDPSVSNENFIDGGSVELEVWEDKLVEGYHPRLVLDKGEFQQLKSMVGGSDVVGKLHDHLIDMADAAVAETEKLEFALDASGKRLLEVCRKAQMRLIPCSYAYRMTGQSRYLDKVVRDLNDVCSFSSWNPTHYLDVAEMSLAVAIAYDWLYDSLSEEFRSKVVTTLKEYALDTSRDDTYTWWYERVGNWNQVCNGGLVCAAAAIYEYYPKLARGVIDDAISTNKAAVAGIYAPDGAYPEGPAYWTYGTLYEVLMLTLFEDLFGTDFGISSAQGFLDTGLFKIFARGSMGMQFNFADNTVSCSSNYPLYYFAYRNADPSLLYTEMELLDKAAYTGSEHKGLMVVALKYAMQMNLSSLTGPSRKFYSAQGNVPIMMCRSGWENDDDYLGIKGGQDNYLHGHMDGGTFVYYADNVRWALDISRQNYAEVEVGLKALGGNLSDYGQNSLRWKLFRLNCRQHNTLTVNDKDHDVTAFVQMTATENTASRMAATFDLTPLFGGDLAKAERTAALCNEEYIEIKDVLKAPVGKSAHVRWTMVTMGTPQIREDGILLTRNSKSRLLQTTGGSVTYRIWSSELEDYDTTLKINGVPVEKPLSTDPTKYIYICGYEIDVPAGQELTLTTTLKKY